MPYEFYDFFSISVKKKITLELIGIEQNQQMALGSMVNLTVLSLWMNIFK